MSCTRFTAAPGNADVIAARVLSARFTSATKHVTCTMTASCALADAANSGALWAGKNARPLGLTMSVITAVSLPSLAIR